MREAVRGISSWPILTNTDADEARSQPQRATPAAERALPHIPELDGVRGIAILLVLAFHSAKGVADFGWMGVDLFFVLSGYLITRGLLETRGSSHYFRDFYIKRALRIWPLYYLLMITVFWVLPASVTGIGPPAGPSPWPFALYLQNLWYPGTSPGHLSATWSLAIEEQFYLVWPLAVALLSRHGVRRLSALLVLLAPLLRWKLAVGGVAPGVIYQLTYCRFDALALGAWFATAPPTESVRLERRSWFAALAGWGTALPLGILVGSRSVSSLTPPANPWLQAVLFTLIALGSVGLVGLAVSRASGAVGRVLGARWLRYLGKISYGIYIFHVPIFLFVMKKTADYYGMSAPVPIKVLRSLIQVSATLAVASVSWRVLEKPLLSLKARLRVRGAGALSPSAAAP